MNPLGKVTLLLFLAVALAQKTMSNINPTPGTVQLNDWVSVHPATIASEAEKALVNEAIERSKTIFDTDKTANMHFPLNQVYTV
jgi:hypothetical protein